MFGLKKQKTVEEATFAGWREKDVRYLADSFTKERARVSFEISGIRHLTRFDGDAFASSIYISRSEHELYGKHALAFDERPANEDSHSLASHEHELLGFMAYPRALMRCQIHVGNPDEVKEGKLGSLFVTGEGVSTNVGSHNPIVEAHFNVQSSEQAIDLRRTMQAALANRGNAFINFMLYPIDNADEWAAHMMKDAYSPSLIIKGAYVTTNVGRDPFE